jgi:POT family proton-dependent oligopeptide transporter
MIRFAAFALCSDSRLIVFVGGGPSSTPLLALIGIVLVFTLAELLLSPVGLSVTTKLAPEAFHTQMVALFYLSVSLGRRSRASWPGSTPPRTKAPTSGPSAVSLSGSAPCLP